VQPMQIAADVRGNRRFAVDPPALGDVAVDTGPKQTSLTMPSASRTPVETSPCS